MKVAHRRGTLAPFEVWATDACERLARSVGRVPLSEEKSSAELATAAELAPTSSQPAEKRRKIIATAVVLVIAAAVYLYLTRYDSEKKVINNFFQAIEQKDFDKAYGIYEGDPDWKQTLRQTRRLPVTA